MTSRSYEVTATGNARLAVSTPECIMAAGHYDSGDYDMPVICKRLYLVPF